MMLPPGDVLETQLLVAYAQEEDEWGGSLILVLHWHGVQGVVVPCPQ